MIEAPPFDTGAVHDTTDEPVAFADETEVAETPDGAPGGPTGTTAIDETDETPEPALFVAVTANVYETPFVKPETVHEVVEEEQVSDPGVDVTV